MENTMFRVLIETIVRTTLKEIRDDPERSIRNLVDLAHQFSGSFSQQKFFAAAQTVLQNETSPYYGLIRDIISYADPDRLLRFGMNLGYNGCTQGVKQIRESEKQRGHHIPWTVLLQMDAHSPQHLRQYDAAISQGEELGIYTWMLFVRSGEQFDLARSHPDSAFFFFCEPEHMTSEVLDCISELKNIMPVLRYREGQREVYAILRAHGVPYAIYTSYAQDDLAAILGGDLFTDAQQTRGIFTVLIPRRECPEAVRQQVCQAVERTRNEQLYRTIPWELEWDNQRVNKIISGDTCCVCLDPDGFPLGRDGLRRSASVCLFDSGLDAVLQRVCPECAAREELE